MHTGIAKRDFRIVEQCNRLILRGETVSVTDEYKHLLEDKQPSQPVINESASDTEAPAPAKRKYTRKPKDTKLDNNEADYGS